MHPSPLFLLWIFLFPLGSTSQKEPDKRYKDCAPSPFSCGTFQINNVSYPFLSDGRPDTCGLPEFKLTCENDSPEIKIGSETFLIRNISYMDQILSVVDKNLVEEQCPLPVLSPVVDSSFFGIPEASDKITFYYNCATPIQNSLFYNVTCLKDYFSYFTLGPPVSYSTGCKVSSWGLGSGLMQLLGGGGGAPVVLSEVLTWGLDVQWNAGADWCGGCENSGGWCGYNSKAPLEQWCFCEDQPHTGNCSGPPITGSNKKKEALIIGVAVAGGASLFIAACFLIFFLLRRYRRRKGLDSKLLSQNISAEPSSRHDLEKSDSALYATHVFSYKELQEATKNFDSEEELGDGGFGTVYYGKLRDGRSVAVKRLYENNYKRVEQFLNEVKILSTLRHRNLVTLYGCTSRHSRELLLVYEFISNGTVADHLHGNKVIDSPLTWPVRMSIAIETAEALAYLHAVEPPIIHRDVKTNNILLDNNFQVKVADFGLSRLFPMDVSHVSTVPQGTPGYVDPDYHKCYQLTDKSDVYSFGVVLVELISSMPAVDITRHRHEINLAALAINKIHNQALHELVDPSLGFETDEGVRRRVTSVAGLAFRCLQEEKEGRPSMVEVVKELKGIEEEESREEKKKMDTPVDEVGLLKYMPPPSPDSVMDATWGTSTKSTTPNTSG